MDIYAVIMAGGSGTRFWPLSRKQKPKQFLPIISEKSMIEETVNRLLPKIPRTNIYTIAGEKHTQVIKSLLPDIPGKNFLIEPQGRNTAPSLILATAVIYLKNPTAVVAALPADHLIQDEKLFLEKITSAAVAARELKHIITFGIPPSFPSTGFGYICFSKKDSSRVQGEDFYPVQEFKEKPDYNKAKSFLKAGNYFWNSGMFLWRADVFAEKLEKYAPEIFPFWTQMLEALRNDDQAQLADIFEKIPATSIDYALMEKAEGVAVCAGNFGWSDVGAWSALADIWKQDENNNVSRGENILLEAGNCILYNPGKLTALVGVKDLIVVDTKDALLICRKDQDQKVKTIVGKLKKMDKKDYL